MLTQLFYLVALMLAGELAPDGYGTLPALVLTGIIRYFNWKEGVTTTFFIALSFVFGASYIPLVFFFLATKNWKQIQFLLPFTLPFYFFEFLVRLLGDGPIFLTSAALFIILILFYPYFMQLFWKSEPYSEPRLEAFCRKLNFRHGGLKQWNVMSQATTAAIVGILPRFRYVMFTQGLLDILSLDEVEAVLAHEIAHSRYKHLLFYPLIVVGMLIFMLFVDNFLPPLHPALLFAVYITLMGGYLRFVFGYFSRLFERQADLYPLQVGIDGRRMIAALDHIAIASGNIHDVPNWHHYSINQRIAFIERAMQNPQLTDTHTRWVTLSVVVFLIYIIGGALWT